MQLKYKEQKIRDLFIYNTNIIPTDIQLSRHNIDITVKKEDLEREGFTEEGVINHISLITGRKIILHVEDTTNNEDYW